MSGSFPLEQIAAALDPHGIMLRGVASFDAGEGPPLDDGVSARSVVLLGNVGGSIWPHFSRWRQGYDGADPLDTWSKSLILPLARALGAAAYFPSDPPYQPFQQWAMRAEDLRPSPLGILLHRRYGLWHGYRGALGFPFEIDSEHAGDEAGPENAGGWEEACAAACPAGAVTAAGFDALRCHRYLSSAAGEATCMAGGCAVRNCCPVGAEYRYPEDQLRFHMAALTRFS